MLINFLISVLNLSPILKISLLTFLRNLSSWIFGIPVGSILGSGEDWLSKSDSEPSILLEAGDFGVSFCLVSFWITLCDFVGHVEVF